MMALVSLDDCVPYLGRERPMQDVFLCLGNLQWQQFAAALGAVTFETLRQGLHPALHEQLMLAVEIVSRAAACRLRGKLIHPQAGNLQGAVLPAVLATVALVMLAACA